MKSIKTSPFIKGWGILGFWGWVFLLLFTNSLLAQDVPASKGTVKTDTKKRPVLAYYDPDADSIIVVTPDSPLPTELVGESISIGDVNVTITATHVDSLINTNLDSLLQWMSRQLAELSKNKVSNDTIIAVILRQLSELSKKADRTDTLLVMDSREWGKFIGGAYDTLNAATADTLSRRWKADSASFANTFTRWWAGDIEVDDTSEVSTQANFAAGTVRVLLPGKLYPLPKMAVSVKDNLYIRRRVVSGATGTVTWNVRFWGY